MHDISIYNTIQNNFIVPVGNSVGSNKKHDKHNLNYIIYSIVVKKNITVNTLKTTCTTIVKIEKQYPLCWCTGAASPREQLLCTPVGTCPLEKVKNKSDVIITNSTKTPKGLLSFVFVLVFLSVCFSFCHPFSRRSSRNSSR